MTFILAENPFSQKILTVCFRLLKFWYLVWLFISVLNMFISVYYLLRVNENFPMGRMAYLNFVLFIKSLLYFNIIKNLNDLFFIKTGNGQQRFKRLSIFFLVLFLFDVLSLFSGSVRSEGKNVASMFLEVISEESFIYPLYTRVYIYLPQIYEFIKPDLTGSSLLIVSLILGVHSLSQNSDQDRD